MSTIPTKELIETFKDKAPEEITSYLYKRLEESHVLMPTPTPTPTPTTKVKIKTKTKTKRRQS